MSIGRIIIQGTTESANKTANMNNFEIVEKPLVRLVFLAIKSVLKSLQSLIQYPKKPIEKKVIIAPKRKIKSDLEISKKKEQINKKNPITNPPLGSNHSFIRLAFKIELNFVLLQI